MVSYHGALWCVQNCDIERVAWCIVHGSLFFEEEKRGSFYSQRGARLKAWVEP